MKTAIVLTTINVPRALATYAANIKAHGHKDVAFVVIGDLKTPRACARYIASLRTYGIECVYLTPQAQDDWLRQCARLRRILPYNSIQRRNIGFLYAAERGAELIVTIDDDNFVRADDDYLGAHNVVGTVAALPTISSSSGWFNVCSLLHTTPTHHFYHRGFPLTERWRPHTVTQPITRRRVIVNVGLWTGDPDVDTITRFEEPFQVTGLRARRQRVSLAPDTTHPFNSQNTAFSVELLPCSFMITLGRIDRHLTVTNFRYDDIWMSYLAKKAIDRMGDCIAFGPPLVHQTRNPHDFLVDLERELMPMTMTPPLLDILEAIPVSSNSYHDIYGDLAEGLLTSALAAKLLSTQQRKCVDRMARGMIAWLTACTQLSATRWRQT